MDASESTNGDDESGSGTRTTRRLFLQGVATASVVSSQMGTATAASDRYTEYRSEFDTVVDVTDLGADPTGTDSVSEVIDDALADDTLLEFPEGRYYMDEQVRHTGFEKVGLVGPEATLVPANYFDFDGPQYRLFRLGVRDDSGTDLVFDGFDVDQTAPDTGIRVIEAVVDDGLEVRDITVDGFHDSGTWGPARVVVQSPTGSGLVERFTATEGGEWVSETPNAGDLWRGPTGLIANDNRGTLTLRDVELGPFPDNGLYAAGSTGPVVVEGGTFRNSNAANVRIGGDGSVVRDATIVVDQIRPQDEAHRGVRIENTSDLRVENVTVRNTAPLPTSPAVYVMNSTSNVVLQDLDVEISGSSVDYGVDIAPEAGETTVHESTIAMSTPGGNGIRIQGGDDPGSVLVEEVTITGDVGEESTRSGIWCDRDNCRFGVVTVDVTSDERRYGIVNHGDGVTMYRGTYRASRYPVVNTGDGFHVEEVYGESRTDHEAVCLYDTSDDVYLKHNTLPGGIRDLGATNLRLVGNEF
ncbi:right-handed parallel beta-helix repeat-containing protein [Haloarculaceae archaeon H-GB2-1]|nr:right-handed parallel beta-helix repeat-containing protein [Haloarculaceae archaeon H-GB1-1]MEA5408414.1 right-handed parallel beta-helix repeat-containing protein [Haloarculaceae archaeon H-GB2-1]